MKRLFLALFTAALASATAHAHFVFVVPARDGATASVVFSEELAPDKAVPIGKIAGIKLLVRDRAGKESPASHKAGDHALACTLPGSGPRLVFGTVVYGVRQRGEGKPFLLEYHPKAVIGDLPADQALVGEKAPAELIPVKAGGKLRLRFVAGGKPAAGAEVTILLPGGTNAKLKTNEAGLTDAVEGAGRFGAWAKQIVPKAGEHGGKKYEEVRHYATLVVDVAAPAYPPLPAAASSLGAIASGGFLYVYGGHAGRTHHYDTKSVLGSFHRIKLNGGTKWEALPGGPILQGMNLAAWHGKVYRVGGMQPRNAPGEPADNISVADVACFDPKAGKWSAMPPLPEPRSSHDVVAVGDKLVVVGGWNMQGKGKKSVWHDTALVLDLSAKSPAWKAIAQPFKRRALTAAVVGARIYVIGGLGQTATDKRVDVLDLGTGAWSAAAPLPGGGRAAFAPAAGTLNGRVVVNTLEGPIYRLSESGDAWKKVGAAANHRIVGRLIPYGTDSVILVGGANRKGNVGEIERIRLAQKGEVVTSGK